MLADAETEVARLREVPFSQLVFLDLQSTLQDFLCFRSSHSDVYSDFLVTTDSERSYSVASFAFDIG